MRKFTASMLTLGFIIANLSIGYTAFAEEDVKITVLATSDIHGKIYPWEYSTDTAQEYGLAKLATIIKQERELEPNLLLLDNGDAIESNMIQLFNEYDIHPMMQAFNLLNYDVFSLGNHEFNFGLDVLNRAIESFDGEVLSANIIKDDEDTFVQPYALKEIDGVKVGILGLITPHIPRWEAGNPEHFEGLTFLDPLTTAEKYVDILKNEEKVDLIIGTFHIGKDSEGYDKNLIDSVHIIAEQVDGIDAIVVGHAHETFGFKDEQIVFGDTIVLEPSSNGNYIGKFTFTLEKDEDGYKIINKESDLLSAKDIEPDKEILDSLKYVDDVSKEAAHKVVGTATARFLQENEVSNIPTAMVMDNPIVDLINDVQLFYTNADISSTALLDTRANIDEGEVQFKDAALIYKYSNTLQAHKISGENLKEYMEWSASYYNTQKLGDLNISFNSNIRAYNYDMFDGIEYQIDITKPVGDRIVNLKFNGEEIKDDDEFTLAVNNYRVGTLRSLGLLPEDNSSLVYDSTSGDIEEIQQLIVDYIINELDGVVTPKVNNNWSIIKNEDTSQEGMFEGYELLKAGILKVPSSEDGRTPNVKSINILDKLTREELTTLLDRADLTVDDFDTDLLNINSGDVFKLVYDKINN